MAQPGARWSADHVRLIAVYGARFALRTGGGLVFLLIVLLVGLGIASIIITPVERSLQNREAREILGPASAEEQTDRILQTEELRHVVEGMTGGDETYSRYLLNENPALLSAIFIILMYAFPFVVVFGAFNQTAGDIGSRGLRYLLLRTERPNVFFGRFAGTVLFALASTLLLMTVLLVYVGAKMQVYSAGTLIGWGAQGLLALVVLALPYMALCSWMSAMMDSAFPALVVSLVAIVVPLLLLNGVDSAVAGDQSWLPKVMPWGWKFGLLSPDVGTRLGAIGAMLGFTGLFLWLGNAIFSKRDL